MHEPFEYSIEYMHEIEYFTRIQFSGIELRVEILPLAFEIS